MAQLQVRQWSDPSRNKLVTVFYDDTPSRAVTVAYGPLDPAYPITDLGGAPRDGITAGTELTRFCEGPDLIVITATATDPFAAFAVTAGSASCDGSTLAIVRVTGFAPAASATTGYAEVQAGGGTTPYSVTVGTTSVVCADTGLGTVARLAPGTYAVTLRDGAGITRTGSVTIPAAVIIGCTLPSALNYDPAANSNSGGCLFVQMDAEPTYFAAAHLPMPVRLRASPLGGQPAVVTLFIEYVPDTTGTWTLAATKTQTADPLTAAVSFNVSEEAKALLRIRPPVEADDDAALSVRMRLRYEVADSAGLVTYTDTRPAFRVVNATVPVNVALDLSGLLSQPAYATRPPDSALWANTVTVVGGVTATPATTIPESAVDWPCPTRQLVWLNRAGGWDSGFFGGRHVHATDQADPLVYRDAAGADHYAGRGTVRPTLQVYSDKLDFATYTHLRGIRQSIQVYERVGAGQYVPVLVASASFTEYQEQTDKTFEVNFTISYPPVLIQTQ